MTHRHPEPTKLFRTLPVSANTVRVSYVVEAPSWSPRMPPERTRVFALLHDARRGWGVEDGRFEHSAPHAGAPLDVQERMRAARRAYDGLAKHGAIPDGVEGYLVVEHPGRKPDENLAAVTYPAPRSFAEVHDAVRLAHAAKGAMYGIAVDHGSSPRVFQGDSAVPHVEEFADGWRVWVPAKHAFVGDRDMQPFRTMADAVDHLDAMKAAARSRPASAPAQRSLFGKANRRAATPREGSTMPARRPAASRKTLFPILPMDPGVVTVTYGLSIPRPQKNFEEYDGKKGFDRQRMFSLIHHPQYGWGIEDDYFERAKWSEHSKIRKRDYDLAHRVYESLAKTRRFPDAMNGYVFVEDPAALAALAQIAGLAWHPTHRIEYHDRDERDDSSVWFVDASAAIMALADEGPVPAPSFAEVLRGAPAMFSCPPGAVWDTDDSAGWAREGVPLLEAHPHDRPCYEVEALYPSP